MAFKQLEEELRRGSFVLLVVDRRMALVPLNADGSPDTSRAVRFEGFADDVEARDFVCQMFVAVTRELVGPEARREAAAVLRDWRSKGRSV
jgi:hypothetical protein